MGLWDDHQSEGPELVMTPYYQDELVTIYCGDNIGVIQTVIATQSIDAVVTDGPYALRFMGRRWDYEVPSVHLWSLVLNSMKPGAHLLSFGGTRTYHRMVCAVEDAGFEIRDMISWVYGCLSEDTEVLLDGGWEPYYKAIEGRLALCYDVEHDTYSWQPIQRLYCYDYNDTAYRIQSDHTDQIVSRNHRCIVERGGRNVFVYAETLERQETIPVLEGLSALLECLPVPHQRASAKESTLRPVQCSSKTASQETLRTAGDDEGVMCGLQEGGVETERLAAESTSAYLFQAVQRSSTRQGMGHSCTQGAGGVDGRGQSLPPPKDEWGGQPRMEGRGLLLSQSRELQADQICTLSSRVFHYVEERRLRDGASPIGRTGNRTPIAQDGGCSSRRPQSAEQHAQESYVIYLTEGSQTVRGTWFTRPDLARVTPVHYRGTVWCVQVPTGAFVARRNGKVFVTGNSGFPKNHDVSKAIDRMAGAEREVVGESQFASRRPRPAGSPAGCYGDGIRSPDTTILTAPATAPAKQWDGWGSALKPAVEPIVLARKPIEGTIAQNVLEYGTGALNIDGSRVESDEPIVRMQHHETGSMRGFGGGLKGGSRTEPQHQGRYPANLIHDGSVQVVEVFPSAPGQQGDLVAHGKNRQSPNGIFGAMSPARDHIKRSEKDKSAARFFYCAKSSRKERGEYNKHPTVKPLALMRYLITLITPPGGIVLDPFMGSGSTILAAKQLGFRAIGIEQNEEYCAIAVRRLADLRIPEPNS